MPALNNLGLGLFQSMLNEPKFPGSIFLFFAACVCLAHTLKAKGENGKYLFLNVLRAEGQFPSMRKMLFGRRLPCKCGLGKKTQGTIAFSRASQQSHGLL